MEKMKVDEELSKLNLSLEGEDLEKATRMRIQGNELYKAGKLEKAIEAYKEAANAAPRDPLPLSNLSAAYFEGGQYQQCVNVSEQAISLAKPGDEETATISKLGPRILKSSMNLSDIEVARKCWIKYNHTLLPGDASRFDSILQQAEKSGEIWNDEKAAKRKVFGMLPKYRQSIYEARLEYYPFGHDDAETLLDAKLAQSTEPTKNLCFIGIGDGRNLFATMIGIAKHAKSAPKDSKFHLTIDDVNACAIARLLLFFQIFNDMSDAKANGTLAVEKPMFITTLYYLFASVAMPPSIFERVHALICKLIHTLEKGQAVTNIDIRNCSTPVLKALKVWRDDAATRLPVSTILRNQAQNTHGSLKDLYEGHFEADGAEHELGLFLQTGAIIAPHLLKDEEKNLGKCLARMRLAPGSAAMSATKSYLEDNWKPNVTALDLEWINGDIRKICFDSNPFDLAGHLYNHRSEDRNYIVLKKPKASSRHLYDHVAPFFDAVSTAWIELEGRFKIEALVGDAIQLFEDLQHDIIDDRPTEYPKCFDRIHMSNVHDYTGGPLSIFLYPAKVLRPGPNHFVMGGNYLNFTAFPTRNIYYNEYMVISDNDTLSRLMQARLLGTSVPAHPMYPIAEYHRWQRTSFEPLPFAKLYPRASLMRWMYALFFKLSVPVGQNRTNPMQRIMQTPNISIFFRVLLHLHEIGYPAHWLSEVLTNILENNVVTSARPPLTTPLDIAESAAPNLPKKLSTAPYILETKSLTTLFQPILPFTVPTILPNPETVHRYAIHIPLFQPIPNLVDLRQNTLVFHRKSLMNKANHFRSKMLSLNGLEPPDEFGLHEPLEHTLRRPFEGTAIPLKHYQKVYEEGVVVISTFDYDIHTNVASFWMSTEDAERVFGGGMGEKEDWKASIWGFWYWERYTPLVSVHDHLEKMEAWIS